MVNLSEEGDDEMKVNDVESESLGVTDLNQEGPCKEPKAKPGFASGASSYFGKLLLSSKKSTKYKTSDKLECDTQNSIT